MGLKKTGNRYAVHVGSLIDGFEVRNHALENRHHLDVPRHQ